MSVFSVPVTIGVDDEAIARKIEADVEKQVVDAITKEVKDFIFAKRGYWDTDKYGGLRDMVNDRIDKVLKEKEDLIIQTAADKLADRLSRQKAVKEKAAAVAEEVYK